MPLAVRERVSVSDSNHALVPEISWTSRYDLHSIWVSRQNHELAAEILCIRLSCIALKVTSVFGSGGET